MDGVSTTEARKRFAELVNEVQYGGKRVRLTRHSKEVAGIVEADVIDFLDDLDRWNLDLQAAREIIAAHIGGSVQSEVEPGVSDFLDDLDRWNLDLQAAREIIAAHSEEDEIPSEEVWAKVQASDPK